MPEVHRQEDYIEMAVVAANREIWTLGEVINFAVVNLNQDLHRAGREVAFMLNGIHFSERLVEPVG